jgi:hypothetical protein
MDSNYSHPTTNAPDRKHKGATNIRLTADRADVVEGLLGQLV